MAEKDRMRKNKIQFYLSDEELKVAKDKSEYANLNMSQFIRKIIFEADIKKLPVEEIKQCQKAITDNAFELNKIGNNINQIAKVIHENNDTYSKSQIEEVKRDLDNVVREYEKLCSVMISKLYGLE